LIGGEISREQRRIAPTVIEVNDRQDPLMSEELFGPLLPMLRMGNLSDALQAIRRQGKPLALYLFGGSEAQQHEVLNTTSSGGVCLNDVVMQAGIPELPFGGVGASGMGSYHGHNGFKTFSHYKAVLKRGFRFDFKLRYPPYSVDLNVLRRIAG
jgi:aldehyde dehydrogenase (NAD+)